MRFCFERNSLILLLVTIFVVEVQAHFGESQQNYVRLHLMPAYPIAMDWSSPKKLLVSSLKATLGNMEHTIGHVTVEVNCSSLGGTDSHIFSGATARRAVDSADLLLREQVGFTVLEVGWPGRLEKKREVIKSIDLRKGSPEKLSVLTFLISEPTCKRLLAYHRELSQTQRFFYGNSPRPRYKEGAGCSAYGVSYLEVAGVMRSEWREEWITARRVPLSLMGGYGAKRLDVARILRMDEAQRWANEDEPHMALETFDPDEMHRWVRELAESPEKLDQLGAKLDTTLARQMPLIPAVVLDRRFEPTPSEPIFVSEPQLEFFSRSSVVRADKRSVPDGSFDLRP